MGKATVVSIKRFDELMNRHTELQETHDALIDKYDSILNMLQAKRLEQEELLDKLQQFFDWTAKITDEPCSNIDQAKANIQEHHAKVITRLSGSFQKDTLMRAAADVKDELSDKASQIYEMEIKIEQLENELDHGAKAIARVVQNMNGGK